MFHVTPLDKLLTTSACILNWGPCFCMFQFIRDSSFVLNVVYIACVLIIVISIFESELTNHRFLNIPVFEIAAQCFLSRFWVSKWHPKILQWHPKFWKPRYGFALYWSKTIWEKHVFLHVAIATDDCNVIGRHNFLAQKMEAKIVSL